MKKLSRALGLAAALVALVGCGAAPAAAPPSSAPATPQVAVATPTAALPTAALPTAVPPAAVEVLPTVAPATSVPPTALPLTPTPQPSAAEPPTVTPTKQQLAAGAAAPTPTPQPSGPSEILFLRGGALTALDPQTRTERVIAEGVSDFAAARYAGLIALVRGQGAKAEIWVVRRDGGGLRQITQNTRADVTPSLAVDGSAVVFASATSAQPYTRQWPDWGQWCTTSEVHLVELATGEDRTLGAGCDPAISPDLKRVAFATPPTGSVSEFPSSMGNTIRMVNRQGQNGWSFAKTTDNGLLVYAPSWSADGSQVLFHRFMGYQVLVDMGLSELALTFKGGGEPVYSGAGWQFPAQFAPDGGQVAITEDNYSDARGLTGYGPWSVTAVKLSGSRSVALPEGTMTLIGSRAETLPLAQGGAWSPDGAALAVILPAGWRPDVAVDAQGAEAAPGELWRWTPGADPKEKLTDAVDFGSPVVWLP